MCEVLNDLEVALDKFGCATDLKARTIKKMSTKNI